MFSQGLKNPSKDISLTEDDCKMIQRAIKAYGERFDSGVLWINSTCGFCGERTEWDSIPFDEPRVSKHNHDCCMQDMLNKFS